MSQKTLFGKHFNLILILTALAWMTYSLPSVKSAMADGTTTASSSYSIGVKPPMGPDARFLADSIPPQEIVSLLGKLGYIQPSRLDQARKDVEHYIYVRNQISRPLPPGLQREFKPLQSAPASSSAASTNVR